jgi:hypothetical protein
MPHRPSGDGIAYVGINRLASEIWAFDAATYGDTGGKVYSFALRR